MLVQENINPAHSNKILIDAIKSLPSAHRLIPDYAAHIFRTYYISHYAIHLTARGELVEPFVVTLRFCSGLKA
jgi:hypothetical protein